MTDSWEERMSQRAAARAVVAEAEQIARDDAADPHRGHHTHLQGTMVMCSCGDPATFGIICAVIDFDQDPAELSCRECGAPGVVLG